MKIPEKIMTNSDNNILIESKIIDEIMYQTSHILDDLQVSASILIKWFFDFFKKETKVNRIEGINFWIFDCTDKLQKIKEILLKKRNKCNHKYKKLHYTYIISRIEDRINEIIHNNWKELDWINKLFYAIDSGNIMLISYNSKSKTRNSILNTIANNALRYFSKSIFAHIGIIWKYNPNTWFDWIHSTLHNDWNRTWVKKIPLKDYLSWNLPSELLIIKYKNNTPNKQKQIINEWLKNVEKQTDYDTWDAIWDLTGLNIFRKKEAFNCWELVYNCLKVIDPQINIEKYTLPASYIDNKYMEQTYLTQIY